MPFDLDNLNAPVRFYWPESESEWVDLRSISAEQIKQFRNDLGIKTRVEYPVNKETRRVERVEYLDIGEEKQDRLSAMITDHTIVAWNLMDPRGNPIACTTENKCKLMQGHPQFASWITDCLSKIRTDSAEQGSIERKNS